MLPPFTAGGAEYCPATPALSLVNVPAVLTVTPSAISVFTLPNVKLPPATIILALILVSEASPAAPPSPTLPFGAIFNASFIVNCLTFFRLIILKPFLAKSASMTD